MSLPIGTVTFLFTDIEGAPFVAQILEAAGQVKVLATSRELLDLRGESVFDVAGLRFADWQTVDQALSVSCAQLFIQGAHQVQPQFELEESEVPQLLRICRLVDGTPLALLLSAGWMDMLSLEAIADEVESSLDFLETELQDAADLQRSIKAVFEGSWDRLEEPERDLFMRLSVFRGGFTPDAAKEVAGATLRSLARLADKTFILERFEEAEASYGLSLQYCYETGQICETLANLTDIARVYKAQGRGREAAHTLAIVLKHPENEQNALFRPTPIREEAEILWGQLEDELNSDEYQAAWDEGSHEQIEDVVRIIKQPQDQSAIY